ncbi:MAG: BPTI/Kunitz domain-containing protein [Labilithrix sp.]|nr:BPTI/Kunitz domain-containing protein [Labilithrix sp.]
MNRTLAAVLIGLVLVACGGSTTPSIGDAGSDDGGGGGSSGSGGGAASTCTLPQEIGPCEAAMQRFWFNQATAKCEAFIYGGCQGNANNFETVAACVAACSPSTTSACDAAVCPVGLTCVYQGATALCAQPCDKPGSGCSGGPAQCECASSCPGCRDCVSVCLDR